MTLLLHPHFADELTEKGKILTAKESAGDEAVPIGCWQRNGA
jgi:hypothetical protein